MVGSNGINNAFAFTIFFSKLGANNGMGAIYFMIHGLANIVKQPHALGKLYVQTKFSSYNTGQKRHFNRMLQNILGIGGSEFELAKHFDKFRINAMHTQVKRSLLAGFFNCKINLLRCTRHNILDTSGMNSSI